MILCCLERVLPFRLVCVLSLSRRQSTDISLRQLDDVEKVLIKRKLMIKQFEVILAFFPLNNTLLLHNFTLPF